MIFVTLGMQKFQFDRLLEALDSLIEQGELKEEVIAQIGYTTYLPKRFDYVRSMSEQEYEEAVAKSRLVIAHCGAGAIAAALKAKKPIIVCPRKQSLGEHVDDHQFELAKAYSEMGYVLVCDNESELLQTIREAETYPFRSYESGPSEVVDYIARFLEHGKE